MTEAILNSPQLPAIERALEQISVAKSKVRLASVRLSAVNADLQEEVRTREMLGYRFAAAVQQHEGTRTAALHDELTGLPNRALFNDRLQMAIAQPQRDGSTLAVMFIDLNDFKSINDSFGHETGDRVLQIVARCLKARTRESDAISRHGGDEFLYLAERLRDVNSAQLIAEKLLREIQEPLDVPVPERDIFAGVTASIGIAVFPKHGPTGDSLIRWADAAMYHAKKSGGGFAFAP